MDINPKQSRLEKHYSYKSKALLDKISHIRQSINHKTTIGTKVEDEVRSLLLGSLPSKYQYASGIVVDSSGGEHDCSRQSDVIIYDNWFNPKLFLDETPGVFPIELVYAIVEVKTVVNYSEMKSCFDNCKSIKSLNFISKNQTISGGHGIKFGKTSKPFHIVFCIESDWRNIETMLSCLRENRGRVGPKNSPDIVVILDAGICGISAETQDYVMQCPGLIGGIDGSEGQLMTDKDPGINLAYNNISYPVKSHGGIFYPIDPARCMLNFVSLLNNILSKKHIPHYGDIFDDYVPEKNRITKTFE